MESRCQIRMRAASGRAGNRQPVSCGATVALRFLTDSKTLSGFREWYVSRRPTLMTFRIAIGRERAFTKMPANGILFQPKAARRKL